MRRNDDGFSNETSALGTPPARTPSTLDAHKEGAGGAKPKEAGSSDPGDIPATAINRSHHHLLLFRFFEPASKRLENSRGGCRRRQRSMTVSAPGGSGQPQPGRAGLSHPGLPAASSSWWVAVGVSAPPFESFFCIICLPKRVWVQTPSTPCCFCDVFDAAVISRIGVSLSGKLQ